MKVNEKQLLSICDLTGVKTLKMQLSTGLFYFVVERTFMDCLWDIKMKDRHEIG